MSRFRKLSQSIWHCQYHLVWVPKYRFRILTGAIAEEVARCIRVFADHVHLLVMVPQKIFLLVGSLGVAGLIGQAAMVLFLTYFLLLSGDTYRRKLVRLSGPLMSSRKITVHILDDINASIQRYMFMLLASNVLVGLLSWIALRWIGLDNAGAWAVAAGLLHVIPYFGPAGTAASIGMAAYMQQKRCWPLASHS